MIRPLLLALGVLGLGFTDGLRGQGFAPALKPASLGYQATNVDQSHSLYAVYDRAEDSWRTDPHASKYRDALTGKTDITARGILRSFDELRAVLMASATFADSSGINGPRLRRSLLDEMDDFSSRLNPESKPQLVVSTRFLPTTRAMAGTRADPEAVYSSMIFFEGAPTQVVLREQTYKDGPIPGVSVADVKKHYATPEQAVEFREVALLIEEIFAEARKDPFERVTRKLSLIDEGWKNYLERGFSQFPWESALNGYVTPLFDEIAWYDPPRWQLIALHPEGGVLLDIRDRSSASVEPALIVHGLGMIRYFGDDRSWFLGVSATASFADEDFGLGFGPSLHFGNAFLGKNVPHLTVSALWHDFDEGSDGPIVAFSVDFWRFFSREGPEGLFRGVLSGTP